MVVIQRARGEKLEWIARVLVNWGEHTMNKGRIKGKAWFEERREKEVD
jgi:hypothetical protein